MRSVIANCWRGGKRLFRKHWRLVQYCFVGLVFLPIGISLYTNWRELSSFKWELDYRWLALSIPLVSASVLSLAAWWTWSVRLLQEPLGWRQGTRIWAVSQLAKYLPGGIWNYVSRAYASERAGVSRRHAALSLVIEVILSIQAAIIVFLASLPFWPTNECSYAELLVLVGIVMLGFIALKPSLLNGSVNLALRVLGREPVDIASLKYPQILELLTGHTLAAFGAGLAFYLMVLSVHDVPTSAAFPMAGMLAISVVAGFLNPLTPHGLGTREGLLIVLLSFYLPLPVAIVISLLSRVWLTVSELLGVLFVSIAFRA